MDCYFCKRGFGKIDWQDQQLLRGFLTALGKIKRRDRTLLCARHQRRVSRAIKRARHLGLLSATDR